MSLSNVQKTANGCLLKYTAEMVKTSPALVSLNPHDGYRLTSAGDVFTGTVPCSLCHGSTIQWYSIDFN